MTQLSFLFVTFAQNLVMSRIPVRTYMSNVCHSTYPAPQYVEYFRGYRRIGRYGLLSGKDVPFINETDHIAFVESGGFVVKKSTFWAYDQLRYFGKIN